MDNHDAAEVARTIKDLAQQTKAFVDANMGTFNALEIQSPPLGVPLKELVQLITAQTSAITKIGYVLTHDALASGFGDNVEGLLREDESGA